MTRFSMKTAGCVLLCATLLFFSVCPAFAEAPAADSLSALITATFDARKAHTTKADALLSSEELTSEAYAGASAASSSYSDWIAIAMGRFGVVNADGTPTFFYRDGQASYLAALDRYVTKAYQSNDGVLSKSRITDAQRCAIAVAALGGNPTSIGAFNGAPVNLIADCSYNSKLDVTRQGLTGVIFALIAKHTKAYAQPANATDSDAALYTYLLSNQLPGGGWTLFGNDADVDITAMTLTALAAAKEDPSVYRFINVRTNTQTQTSIPQAIDRALTCLSKLQLSGGDFATMSMPTCESVAQVLTALSALGIDAGTDPRFQKNGNSVLDGLLSYRLTDGGFTHIFVTDPENPASVAGGYNTIATDQAAYALVAYWRSVNGLRGLYDMRPDVNTSFAALVQHVLQIVHVILSQILIKK